MFKFLKEKLRQWTEKIAKAPKQVKEKEEKKEKVAKAQKEKAKKEIKEKIKPVEQRGDIEKNIFQKIGERVSKVKITEEDFEKYNEELEILLLENNVAFEVVDKIIKALKEQIVGKEFLKKEIDGQI